MHGESWEGVNRAGYTLKECKAGGKSANQIKDYYIEPKWFEGGMKPPTEPAIYCGSKGCRYGPNPCIG